MAFDAKLHARLIARQSAAELERKCRIAQGRQSRLYPPQELLDLNNRKAEAHFHGLGFKDWSLPGATMWPGSVTWVPLTPLWFWDISR